MYYSHSFQDPETGEIIDVMVDDDRDIRNAGPRDHRPGGHRPQGGAPPWRHPGHQGGNTFHPRPHNPNQGHGPVAPGGRVVVRRPDPRPPQPVPGSYGMTAAGDHIVISKAAIAEAITFVGPAIGQVWASFLGLPEPPESIGDHVTDRDNAAMHRDALARHQQNQTRILTLTELASRAARLLFT